MKDKTHHLKYLQKKIVQSAKREDEIKVSIEKTGNPVDFKRPKTILNKKKAA